MRLMQVIDRINGIAQRASGLNLTLSRLCVLAGVDYGNVRRWKLRLCSPRLDLFEATMSTLERKLDDLEEELRQRLALPADHTPPMRLTG